MVKRNSFYLLAAVLLFSFSASANAYLDDTQYFNFAGWDHDLVSSSSGQTFTDIYGDVDVTVSTVGVFDYDTGYGGGWINTGGHATPGSHTLRFSFSEPISLVVKTNSVDPDELLTVRTHELGNKSYAHHSGAAPTVSIVDDLNMRVQGNGSGFGAMGASSGEIYQSTPADFLQITHQALANNKFERVMVGVLVPVPEPNSFGLLAIGMLALVRRKRGNK